MSKCNQCLKCQVSAHKSLGVLFEGVENLKNRSKNQIFFENLKFFRKPDNCKWNIWSFVPWTRSAFVMIWKHSRHQQRPLLSMFSFITYLSWFVSDHPRECFWMFKHKRGTGWDGPLNANLLREAELMLRQMLCETSWLTSY